MGNLLGSENTVIEGVDWREEDGGDTDGALKLIVRPRPQQQLGHRCGICGKKRPRYDNGHGRCRWGRWTWARCARTWRQCAAGVVSGARGDDHGGAVGLSRRRMPGS